MYFYDNNLTIEENLRKLMNDYNRMCASIINNKVGTDNNDEALKSEVDYLSMMSGIDIPTNGGGK